MKTIANRVVNIILFLIMGVSVTLAFLEKFCVDNWDNLALATIERQLRLSIEGTDSTLINTFLGKYFIYVVGIILISISLFIVFHTVGNRIGVRIVFFDKTVKKTMYSKYSKSAILILVVSIFFILYYGNRIGLYRYIDNRINPSTIFEEYYVDTKNVNISFPEDKKNLILIYAESMEAGYASIEEGGAFEANYIPHLTELAKENINFSNNNLLGGGFCTEGTSDFTAAALMASMGGVPFLSDTGNNAGEFGKIMPGLINMGDILRANGYNNYFQCGSDAEFGSRGDFFVQHGRYTIYDYKYSLEKGDIPEGYHNGFWGYEDKYLFDIARDKLTSIAEREEPFNYTMLTVDTHFPAGYRCDLCRDECSDYYANSITCVDRQINEFINWCREQRWFENTVIVIVGDHTTMTEGFVPDGHERVTYNCFIGADGRITDHNTKGRFFTTMDYFPTILASLGVTIDGDRLGLGTNLFSDKKTVTEEMGFDNYMSQINRFSNVYYKEIDMK